MFDLKKAVVVAIAAFAFTIPAGAYARAKSGCACQNTIMAHIEVIKKKPKKKARKKARLPRNHALWIRIGRCEQPGGGYMGINWSHHGPTYQGGLGFWYGTWRAYKLPGYPANAGDATWRQQMIVAQRVANAVGYHAWGCY